MTAALVFLNTPANVVSGSIMNPALQVALEDNGTVLQNFDGQVTVSLRTNPTNAALSGTVSATAVNGIATFSNLAVSLPGSGYELAATSSGVTSAVSSSFAASAPPSSVTVSITPGTINLTSTQYESFAATVGNASNTAVTWSMSPNLGTLQSGPNSSYYSSPTSITTDQTVNITITSVADPTKSATATILLNSPSATSSTAIQPLGAIPSTQPLNGLGFNIDPQQWEFQLAAAAGTTHVRFQCGWVGTETQTAPPLNRNTSTKYILDPNCQTDLALSKQYGMQPSIIAAFGAPYHTILNVSVPGGAAAGSKTINIQFASGVGGDTFSSLAPFYDTIIGPNNTQITSHHSYAGALVTNVSLTDSTHAILTLASALTAALPADTTSQYTISEYLYPPAATSSPTDPSVLAFANYATFLAQSIASAGLTGNVEIWNEPPWGDDPWDAQVDFYDTFPGFISPGPQSQNLPNWGFAAALQNQTPVAGVTYIWGGTEKAGDSSVLSPAMLANTGAVFNQPATNVTSESLHPYGNNPEDAIWSELCLEATINPYPAAPSYFTVCNLNGASSSNFLVAEQESLVQKSRNPTWGVAHNVTETGFGLGSGDALHQARFIMRQFLGFQAAGVTPIDFYRFYDTSSGQFGFTNPTTEAPLPSYNAIAGLMSDVGAIGNAPISSYSTSALASVVSYNGTYILDTLHIVGSKAGDTANSEVFTLWQQSEAPNTGIWATLAQPAAGPVTVAIPTGTRVSKVLNLDTRAPITYTTAGQQITFGVSDDPIEVLIVPSQ